LEGGKDHRAEGGRGQAASTRSGGLNAAGVKGTCLYIEGLGEKSIGPAASKKARSKR